MLESSNVEPIIELTAMIATSRSYQAAQRIIDTEHKLQRKVADTLPKFG
jgi:flagellar basal body rod protein FlgG